MTHDHATRRNWQRGPRVSPESSSLSWLLEQGANQHQAEWIIDRAGDNQAKAAVELARHMIVHGTVGDDSPDKLTWGNARAILVGLVDSGTPTELAAGILDEFYEYPNAKGLSPKEVKNLIGGAVKALNSSIFKNIRPL